MRRELLADDHPGRKRTQNLGETGKRSQDLRRKLLNKGGVRLIENTNSGGLLTLCVPCWRDKEPYFWSSVHVSFSEAHWRHVKNSTYTWNFTHRFYSFQCAAAASPTRNHSYYLHRATGWATGTSENGRARGAAYRTRAELYAVMEEQWLGKTGPKLKA